MQNSAHVNKQSAEMSTIGTRLAEERKRLGYNQTAFSALGGAAKRTMIDWEKDIASPNAAFLSSIADAGADVQYIITGQRSGERLPNREASLLDNYRHSDERGKKIIEQTATLAAEPAADYEVKKRG